MHLRPAHWARAVPCGAALGQLPVEVVVVVDHDGHRTADTVLLVLIDELPDETSHLGARAHEGEHERRRRQMAAGRGVRSPVEGVGGSLYHIGLQPLSHRVTASIT